MGAAAAASRGARTRRGPAAATERAASSIQVLLQAAEFLERRERRHRVPPCLAEAEHGYASPCPARPRQAGSGGRSVHNALEKHRRAQLRRCLEQLKQQVPLGAGPARSTTLSLLRRARLHIQVSSARGSVSLRPAPALTPPVPQRLQEQEVTAQRVKDRLRSRQRNLRQRLEQLLSPGGTERIRADSLDSSRLSEQSGSDGEEAEIDVEGAGLGAEPLVGFSTGRDHSYSSPRSPWS
ncbi:max dimerization protein 3 isoform X1 [Coturnix japonica]|uniref:max dimerization protein 3 isoform X1 n=1 Tax=Coturnix japonica TaxID=93934 RepID=UPI00077784A0|nr:max dimerization protein 3 isoform X1 [Coturnix japonica]